MDGLCESDADGSFLHVNWNKDLRFFSDGEDGGQQLLQVFIVFNICYWKTVVVLFVIYKDICSHSLTIILFLQLFISCGS